MKIVEQSLAAIEDYEVGAEEKGGTGLRTE